MKTPKLGYFDLEISYSPALEPFFAETAPEAPLPDIWEMWPFGISIGAVKLSTEPRTILWYDIENYTLATAQSWSVSHTKGFVRLLQDLHDEGYRIFGMNSTGFDWQLLYRTTEDDRCITLCQQSYDPCFQILCMVGYPVGLETLAVANNVPHAHKEMAGKSAPKEWYVGHYQEVMTYVAGDVLRLEGVVKAIAQKRGAYWQTKGGGLRWLMFPHGFLTVEQCLNLPRPDTSWMDNPIKREDAVEWMSL